MTVTDDYPRDLIGYGRHPPQADWPGNARVAVQFVLNYEEGGENCVLHGDAGSEQFLSEIIGAQAYPARHLSMESIYEYGSRVGAWRILREFERRGLPLTVFGVAMAMQRNPDFVRACLEQGPRDREPWLALDPLPGHGRSAGTRTPAARRGDPARTHRRRTAGLVYRPRQPETRAALS